MASKFAHSIVRDVLLAIGIRSNEDDRKLALHNVDTELQEVRAVFSQTADRRYPEDSHGHCWCRKDLTNDQEPHNEFCKRARALWERLTVKEG